MPRAGGFLAELAVEIRGLFALEFFDGDCRGLGVDSDSDGKSGLTSVRLQATVVGMKIQSFIHKGLKRLYEEDSTKGIPADAADKLRKMLTFLDGMGDAEELRGLPTWKAHTLTGDRKGAWSLSVTANLRLTFRIDAVESEIRDVNLEDYH